MASTSFWEFSITVGTNEQRTGYIIPIKHLVQRSLLLKKRFEEHTKNAHSRARRQIQIHFPQFTSHVFGIYHMYITPGEKQTVLAPKAEGMIAVVRLHRQLDELASVLEDNDFYACVTKSIENFLHTKEHFFSRQEQQLVIAQRRHANRETQLDGIDKQLSTVREELQNLSWLAQKQTQSVKEREEIILHLLTLAEQGTPTAWQSSTLQDTKDVNMSPWAASQDLLAHYKQRKPVTAVEFARYLLLMTAAGCCGQCNHHACHYCDLIRRLTINDGPSTVYCNHPDHSASSPDEMDTGP